MICSMNQKLWSKMKRKNWTEIIISLNGDIHSSYFSKSILVWYQLLTISKSMCNLKFKELVKGNYIKIIFRFVLLKMDVFKINWMILLIFRKLMSCSTEIQKFIWLKNLKKTLVYLILNSKSVLSSIFPNGKFNIEGKQVNWQSTIQ